MHIGWNFSEMFQPLTPSMLFKSIKRIIKMMKWAAFVLKFKFQNNLW